MFQNLVNLNLFKLVLRLRITTPIRSINSSSGIEHQDPTKRSIFWGEGASVSENTLSLNIDYQIFKSADLTQKLVVTFFGMNDSLNIPYATSFVIDDFDKPIHTFRVFLGDSSRLETCSVSFMGKTDDFPFGMTHLSTHTFCPAPYEIGEERTCSLAIRIGEATNSEIHPTFTPERRIIPIGR